MLRYIVLIGLAGLLAACAQDPVSSPAGRGRQVYAEHCAACHSLSPEVVIIGPSLSEVAARAQAAGDPREYLERAILSPSAEVLDGFEDLMPGDFEGKLAPEDLEALLAFLLTLE